MKANNPIRRHTKLLKAASILIPLIIMVGLVISGFNSHASANRNVSQSSRNSADLLAYTRAFRVVDNLYQGRPVESVDGIAEELSSTTEYWLSKSVQKAYALSLDQPAGYEDGIRAVSDDLSLEIDKAIEESSRLSLERVRLNTMQSVLAVSAVFVSFLAFTMFWAVLKRDEELAAALETNTKTQAEYRFLLDNVPIGLFKFADRALSFQNPAWTKMLGLGRAQPTEAEALEQVVESDRDAAQGLFEAMKEAEGPTSGSFQVLSGSGQTRHIRVESVQAPAPEGDSLVSMAFGLDVTEETMANQALKQKSVEIAAANLDLEMMLTRLQDNVQSMVHSMVRAVEAKDPYTAGHSERVKTYSQEIAKRLGLREYDLQILELGTLVHDVGKIGIPDSVLRKPDRLTEDEFDLIKNHPDQGVRILEGIKMFDHCLPIVRSHHEKLDGSGYPEGLKGDEIPTLVRIATVADIFDAMTSTRTYRTKISTEKVLEIMQSEVDDGKIDADAYAALVEVLNHTGLLLHKIDEEIEPAA